MALDTALWIAIATASGAIGVKVWEYYRPKKKEVGETTKMTIETKIMSDVEQRDKDKFCQEQLINLENRYKDLQSEMDALRLILKKVMTNLDETERKYREALNDITFLKIELAAYKK